MSSRKSGNKWKTEKCERCGDPHSRYSGKLDADNVEPNRISESVY